MDPDKRHEPRAEPGIAVVVIADDDAPRRRGIERLLAGEELWSLHVVAGGSEAVVRALRSVRAAALVVGFEQAPDRLGQLLGRVRELDPEVGIVVLSAWRDRGRVRAVLRAGARGFVLREDALGELAVAVRIVTAGGRYVSPALGAEALTESERATVSGDQLTERELAVLRLVALGHTHPEVAARLYLSLRTIESVRASLARKLGADSRADLVREALARELLHEGGADAGAVA